MANAGPTPGLPSELRPTLPAWAQVTPERLHHIQRVAELVALWSEQLGVPDSERNRWLKAVWLHDALRDAAPEELESYAPSTEGPPELRHGPASAARAKAEGETDRGVLDAVRYHSVGLAEWDMVGRVLYCADFLEPGRRFAGPERAALAARFPVDPQYVLYSVARSRMGHLIESGWIIPQPTLRFWNSLVAGLVVAVGVVALLAAGTTWALLGRGGPAPGETPAALAGDERIIVEVLNGSGVRGLARVATRVLRQAGFDVVYFGNVGDSVRVTQALARRGDSAAAARVARALGTTRARVARDTLLRVDVTVLLGDDYRPPPGIRP